MPKVTEKIRVTETFGGLEAHLANGKITIEHSMKPIGGFFGTHDLDVTVLYLKDTTGELNSVEEPTPIHVFQKEMIPFYKILRRAKKFMKKYLAQIGISEDRLEYSGSVLVKV